MKLNKTLTLLTTLTISAILTACGGGGSSSGGAGSGDNLPQAKIDSTNQKQVTAILFDSIDITTPQLPSITTDTGSASAKQAGSSDSLHQALLKQRSLKTVSSDAPYSCSDGGTVTSSTADSISTITYDHCQESGTTINGTLNIAYNASTGIITYTLKEYSIEDSTHTYTTPSTTYKLSSDTISYTTTGEAVNADESMEFDNYHYTLSLVGDKVNVSVNGAVKTQELGNWITLKTNEVMQLADNTCPLKGNLEVQGENSKLKVLFSNDKSVDVYLGDALVEEYEDCNKLPDTA